VTDDPHASADRGSRVVDPDETSRPFLRVVRGDPTAEEVAALVAVLASMSASPPAAKARARSTWADPRRRVRTTLPHGPGAWRASALPR
jgi:hypothetical protein